MKAISLQLPLVAYSFISIVGSFLTHSSSFRAADVAAPHRLVRARRKITGMESTRRNFHTNSTLPYVDDDMIVDFSSVENALHSLGVVHTSVVQVLSVDPLIYVVPNLLSTTECESYLQYIHSQEDTDRVLTRSNPPDVSLDISKLWPLPFLSLLAGIPPYFRLDSSRSDQLQLPETLLVVAPPVLLSLVSMAALGFLIVVPLIRWISNSSSRTSVATALNLERDVPIIRPLVERATASVLMQRLCRPYTWKNWEAPVITRYDVGAIFSRHNDASPFCGNEWKDVGGQRLVTCICYLNTLDEGMGGETYFDKLNLRVSPQAGTALFFYPADSVSWKADDRTTHESLPPSAEKWIIQLFGRAERVPQPLGLPDSYTTV
jgi:2OG-Fe(II) oxygenase superfamily